MDENKLHHNLENLEAPEVYNPSHQHRLRVALLAAYDYNRSAQPWLGLQRFFAPLKVFSASGVTVALIVVITAFGFIAKNQPDVAHAEAQGIIGEALVGVAALPDAEREALGQVLGVNITTALAEAYDAPDLRYIGKQDVEVEYEPSATATTAPAAVAGVYFSQGIGMSPLTPKPFNHQLSEAEAARFRELSQGVRVLQFTNAEGHVVQMGIGKDRTPVVRVITVTEDSDSIMTAEPATPEQLDALKLKDERQEHSKQQHEQLRRFYAVPAQRDQQKLRPGTFEEIESDDDSSEE